MSSLQTTKGHQDDTQQLRVAHACPDTIKPKPELDPMTMHTQTQNAADQHAPQTEALADKPDHGRFVIAIGQPQPLRPPHAVSGWSACSQPGRPEKTGIYRLLARSYWSIARDIDAGLIDISAPEVMEASRLAFWNLQAEKWVIIVQPLDKDKAGSVIDVRTATAEHCAATFTMLELVENGSVENFLFS